MYNICCRYQAIGLNCDTCVAYKTLPRPDFSFRNFIPLQLEKEAGMIDRQRKELLINYNIRVNFVLPKYTFTIKDKSALHVIRVKRARILLTEWRVSMKDNT